MDLFTSRCHGPGRLLGVMIYGKDNLLVVKTSGPMSPGALIHHFQLRDLRILLEDRFLGRCHRPGHLLGVVSRIQLHLHALIA